MSEAREIELGPLAARRAARPGRGQPQRPRGDAAAHRGVPGQRASRSRPTPPSSWPGPTAPMIRQFVDGAGLPVHQRLRGRADHPEDRVDRRRGAGPGRRPGHHARQGRRGRRAPRRRGDVRVPVAPADAVADPTGVGDGFRAGFLAALAWGLPAERCAQVGLPAGHPGARDRRHPGVRPRPAGLPGPAGPGLRGRRRRGRRAAPADPAALMRPDPHCGLCTAPR